MQCNKVTSWLHFLTDTKTPIPQELADMVVRFLRTQGRISLCAFLKTHLGTQAFRKEDLAVQHTCWYSRYVFMLYQRLYMDPNIPVDMDYQTGTVFLLLCRSILYAQKQPQFLVSSLGHHVVFVADLFMMCFSAAFV